MAIYRLSADVVKRADGRTVTAAAAYRAGECIIDHRIGLVFDYRPRRGVMHRAILTPADAPQWMSDRTALWNAVEAAEKRKDAQLAREIILALPHELGLARQHDLVHAFAAAAFVGAGMVADIVIHAPDRHGDERNHHAHILLTLRVIDGDTFGAKARTWNAVALLEKWRAQWADHVNRALAAADELARVDHRSLAARGIARQPQPKLGPAVRAMEARGILTDKGDELRAVLTANAEIILSSQFAAIDPPSIVLPVPAIDLYQRADTALAGQVHDAQLAELVSAAGMRVEIDGRKREMPDYPALPENAPATITTRPNVARSPEMPAIAVSTPEPVKRTIGGGIRELFRVVMKKVLRRGAPEPQPRPHCRHRYRKQLEPPRAVRHMGPFAQ